MTEPQHWPVASERTSVVVQFSADLGGRIVEALNGGRPPGEIVQGLIERRIDPRAARAVVDAFVAARREGRPVPAGSVTVETGVPDYTYEAPRLPRGPRIVTFDRTIDIVVRAERPVVAALAGVLTPEECGQLLEMARPRLEPSTVADARTGKDVVSTQRTSLGMFFRPGENDLVARLDRRMSEVPGLPVENGEGLQILYYGVGAEFPPHFDFLIPSNKPNQDSIARSGQRVSTLIAYLNDVEEGGETVFPSVPWTVFPKRGSAVYFEYCNSRGQVDPRTLHAGRPVLRGEKWIATKWMRERPFVTAAEARGHRHRGTLPSP
jgi:prolyl 4-hydroxylase